MLVFIQFNICSFLFLYKYMGSYRFVRANRRGDRGGGTGRGRWMVGYNANYFIIINNSGLLSACLHGPHIDRGLQRPITQGGGRIKKLSGSSKSPPHQRLRFLQLILKNKKSKNLFGQGSFSKDFATIFKII